MVFDGLTDVFNNQHMGVCAELCARENSVSREEQDAFAIESYRALLQLGMQGLLPMKSRPWPCPSARGTL